MCKPWWFTALVDAGQITEETRGAFLHLASIMERNGLVVIQGDEDCKCVVPDPIALYDNDHYTLGCRVCSRFCRACLKTSIEEDHLTLENRLMLVCASCAQPTPRYTKRARMTSHYVHTSSLPLDAFESEDLDSNFSMSSFSDSDDLSHDISVQNNVNGNV